MGIEDFRVVLKDEVAVYFPGQTVHGKVHFTLTESVSSKGVRLEGNGKAFVRWTTSDGKHTYTFVGREDYLQSVENLLYEDGREFEIPAGRHEFPFSFQLPEGIPSSFEGKHGRVRYSIKAVIVRSLLQRNFECKQPFTVNAPLDLNTITEAKMPGSGSAVKNKFSLLRTSGPISIKVWIDHCGFVPGQKIFFNATIDNQSGDQCRETKVQLIQEVKYVTKAGRKHPSNWSKHTLYEVKRGSFGAFETWDRVPIEIPPVVPSHLPGCGIIDINYKLLFTLDPSALSRNVEIPIEVIIGNVPLREVFSDLTKVEASGGPAPTFPAFSLYPELQPPSYDACMFNDHIRDEDDKDNDTEFAPRYATYKF